MAFNFKHTGRSMQQATSTSISTGAPVPTPAKVVIGIKTPLALGTDELLEANYDIGSQVADNLRNLVQTNWGERLAIYDYGANVGPLLSELVSQEDFDSTAMTRISDAVAKWMPYVQLNTFTSKVLYSENTRGNSMSARLMQLNYDVPAVNIQNKSLEIFLYVM